MNKIVVITGASRGLGLSLAERFLQNGDTVIGLSRTERYWKSAKTALTCPEKFILKKVDLCSETQIKSFWRELIKKYKRIDILINNAGYGGGLAKLEKLSLKEFETNINTNLLSAFLMTKYALPIFQKLKQGIIVNISSMAGVRAVPGLFAYSASKFGLSALTQCIVKENEQSRIQAYTLCPGGMNTEMRAQIFGKADAARQQSPDFVAGVLMQILEGKLTVANGSDVVVRHSKVTMIRPLPSA
ncbi:MAG: SDR family oxidoreductase [Candidatus Omnitrophica bacterium]|nr:SDR family oxidoreductase [Candidatus Omnitrophota bacterium]